MIFFQYLNLTVSVQHLPASFSTFIFSVTLLGTLSEGSPLKSFTITSSLLLLTKLPPEAQDATVITRQAIFLPNLQPSLTNVQVIRYDIRCHRDQF